MFQRMRKSLVLQVIVAIIFSSVFVTSMISLILFNMSTNYIETFYEHSLDSDNQRSSEDILSFEEYRALFFSRLVMLILIAGVVSIYIAINLADLITLPIMKFSEYVSKSAEDILKEAPDDELLSNPNEIGKLAIKFDDMRLRVLTSFDQRLESTSALVRGVSHRLNTPLGNALSSVSYLEYIIEKEENIPEDIREKLREAISISASSLNQSKEIIDTFREISTHENDLTTTVFDIGEYISQYVEIIASDRTNSHFFFRVSVEPNLYVNSYPQTVMQIITALVKNTREHGYNDCVANECKVHIDAFKNKAAIHIIYKDFGVGISDDIRNQIFEPFFTTKPFGEKTGLGLSIVYNQVQKLGGMIETLPDRDGAAFLIKLPEYGGAHD